MPMTKAEMEAHRVQYHLEIAKARAAEQAGLYREAIAAALASWDHIDGMMQFERKYEEGTFSNIDGLELVLRYAPLLFDFESLDKLETLLKIQRRIVKNSAGDLPERLGSARELMWVAHRIWNEIERRPQPLQPPTIRGSAKENDRSTAVTDAWEKMRLLHWCSDGTSYHLAFSTQMDRAAFAKCPVCGAVAKGPKRVFLDEVKCPKCSGSVTFVILAREN
ncbi:MAG TPA: hypothetical protein VGY55_11345 [Pirellulales bacterium]|nr:hypothetical protein [Pirellulales bacterium]